jgi:8-oxo-dGTP diphosphatase
LAEGVARELFEETGLRIRVLELLGAFDRISLDAQGRPLYHFVILDYLCDLDAGESCPGSDAAALAWATEEQLASFSLAKETERVIRKAFSRVKERSSARR